MLMREFDRVAKALGVPYFLAYGTLLGAVRHEGFIPWDWDVDVVVHYSDIDRLRTGFGEISAPEFVLHHSGDPGYDHLFPRVTFLNEDSNWTHVDVFPLAPAPSSALGARIALNLARILSTIYLIRKVRVRRRYEHNKKRLILAGLLKVPCLLIPGALVRSAFQRLASLPQAGRVMNLGGSYGQREILPADQFASACQVTFRGMDFPAPADPEGYLTHFYGDFREVPDRASQDAALRFFNDVIAPRIGS